MLKCVLNSLQIASMVCPTYCFLHLVQVMQYMKFEFLQSTLPLAVYSRPLKVLVIVPEWLILGQYLHFPVLALLNFLPDFGLLAMSSVFGAVLTLALTSLSLRFGNLL